MKTDVSFFKVNVKIIPVLVLSCLVSKYPVFGFSAVHIFVLVVYLVVCINNKNNYFMD